MPEQNVSKLAVDTQRRSEKLRRRSEKLRRRSERLRKNSETTKTFGKAKKTVTKRRLCENIRNVRGTVNYIADCDEYLYSKTTRRRIGHDQID